MTQQQRISVYCAGKINESDWREKLIGRHAKIAPANPDNLWEDNFIAWPIVPLENGYEYVGPYFTYAEHCYSHGPNTHGAAPLNVDEFPDRRRIVVNLCQQAIELCDIMFVWLDDVTAYGTIAEIGYAAAFNKKIFIAGPRKFPDLWFSYQMAYRVMISDMFTTDWIQTLINELYIDHAYIEYPAYLQTARWRMVRQYMLDRYKGKCGLCNSDKLLNVHHRTYENRGCEQSSDLIVLCRSCHAKFHDKIDIRYKSGENW